MIYIRLKKMSVHLVNYVSCGYHFVGFEQCTGNCRVNRRQKPLTNEIGFLRSILDLHRGRIRKRFYRNYRMIRDRHVYIFGIQVFQENFQKRWNGELVTRI